MRASADPGDLQPLSQVARFVSRFAERSLERWRDDDESWVFTRGNVDLR